MAFAEDLTDFINDDTPGYVLVTFGGVEVGGLFDEPSAQAFGYVEGSKPTVSCIESDVPGIKRGDALTITKNEVATAYVVGGAPKPDGTGLIVLPLELNQ